jgi:hypothetical protein
MYGEVRYSALEPVMIVDLRSQARPHAPSLPVLPHLADSALAIWRGRMVDEYLSARGFDALARQLEAAGLEPEIVDECRGFGDQQRRHGILCGAVVEALGGEARFRAPSVPEVPVHADVSRTEAALRTLLSVACLSETVAVALIGAERLEMPEGPLRELLTSIYVDDVDHARFGWRLAGRLAATLDGAALARIGEYLKIALADLEKHELAHRSPFAEPPKEGACLGLCNGRDARALFYSTVLEVILPRLEALGLPARYAWSARRRAFSRPASFAAA